MLLSNVLNAPLLQPIRSSYEQWYAFMEEKVDFWLSDSEWHTQAHCARVLLFSLLIGHLKKVSEEEMNTLAVAAVFHDSRRLDDGADTGHGKRAAEYYKEFCRKENMFYSEQAYYIMSYHDLNDSLGISEMKRSSSLPERTILLYKIFKDADALDRFRFGPYDLNINYLRTEEALQLVDFAKDLFPKD